MLLQMEKWEGEIAAPPGWVCAGSWRWKISLLDQTCPRETFLQPQALVEKPLLWDCPVWGQRCPLSTSRAPLFTLKFLI